MAHFVKLIDEAVAWVDQQEGSIDEKLRDAIKCRLAFRRNLLYALEGDVDIQSESTEHFASCLSQVPSITDSVSLGKPIPEAFSEKVQRKLASTVPPRPIVKISIEDALGHMKRLCQDAIDLKEVLDYRGAHNTRVCCFSFSLRFFIPACLTSCRSLSGPCCLENPNLPSISDHSCKHCSSATLPFSRLYRPKNSYTMTLQNSFFHPVCFFKQIWMRRRCHLTHDFKSLNLWMGLLNDLARLVFSLVLPSCSSLTSIAIRGYISMCLSQPMPRSPHTLSHCS